MPGPAADGRAGARPACPPADGPVLLHHYRIDGDHCNAFEAWKRMGSPQQPTPEQYAELERPSDLALLGSPEWLRPEGGKLTLRFALRAYAPDFLGFSMLFDA